ncbi:glycine zipper 2TM domain-containing protein [Ramlibacter sp.]|uniref:glycine zipper 2TM domain-containing protein n=1 Tax=Ramlibacter sp. TaxID=1917967 RepID=UPI002BA475C7|nr:glycine zipper 2TM domain-containing protein [Ramlibacter sp.]HWI83611.1 glycine zipper 2TM domain-containing protein [Ramlibacter sp.]
MKTKIVAAALAAASLLGLAGCAGMDRQTAGTVGGAVVGGVVGDALTGSTLGTVGGAAAGAYLGREAAKR